MQANWSLILNVILLMGVIYAIIRVLRTRRKAAQMIVRPSIGQIDTPQPYQDDIIAVRKINEGSFASKLGEELHASMQETMTVSSVLKATSPQAVASQPHYEDDDDDDLFVTPEATVTEEAKQAASQPNTLMMFLLAKSDRQFAGYELLQAVLAAGLRYGDGDLFHRHQHANGQGPVMCSLAAATDSGVFDMQNIGAFSVRGLCLYMQASGNSGIDEERFDMMLDTAKILSDDLDAYLLDDKRQPLSDASIQRYHRMLHLAEEVV